MKRLFTVMSLSLLAALPLAAQSRSVDVIGYATWVDISGDSAVNGPTSVDSYRTNFKSDLGYGAAVNVFLGKHISTEFAAAVVKPDVTLRRTGGVPANFAGSLQMIPLTATLQYHFSPNGGIDPYIGGGAAYVLFDDVKNGRDLAAADVDRISLKDDVGFVVNGGLDFRVTPLFHINLDGKYVPVKSSARAVFVTGPGQTQKIDVNPLMLSAGVRLVF